tara:strand:- start:342 stop:518 length:177 start_codon:yes stop_codon:yes gene_type:complete
MKKILGIVVLGLLLSGNASAFETPMKKLSKYFKNGAKIFGNKGSLKKTVLKVFYRKLT